MQTMIRLDRLHVSTSWSWFVLVAKAKAIASSNLGVTKWLKTKNVSEIVQFFTKKCLNYFSVCIGWKCLINNWLSILQVVRSRNQLVTQSFKQLNTYFNRRTNTTGPPLAVHRVKVTFTDEPGEGSGVARSFYTALANVRNTLSNFWLGVVYLAFRIL